MTHSFSRLRVALLLFGCFAVLFLPWWVTAFIIIFLALRYAGFEAVLLALLLDLAWLPGSFTTAVPYATLASLALLAIAGPLRRFFETHFAF